MQPLSNVFAHPVCNRSFSYAHRPFIRIYYSPCASCRGPCLSPTKAGRRSNRHPCRHILVLPHSSFWCDSPTPTRTHTPTLHPHTRNYTDTPCDFPTRGTASHPIAYAPHRPLYDRCHFRDHCRQSFDTPPKKHHRHRHRRRQQHRHQYHPHRTDLTRHTDPKRPPAIWQAMHARPSRLPASPPSR